MSKTDSFKLALFPDLQCESCHAARKWDDIEVHAIDMFPKTPGLGIWNFKYCKDKPGCKEFAEKWEYNENKF